MEKNILKNNFLTAFKINTVCSVFMSVTFDSYSARFSFDCFVAWCMKGNEFGTLHLRGLLCLLTCG